MNKPLIHPRAAYGTLYSYAIVFTIIAFSHVPAMAQSLNLKQGQKFSYELLDNFKMESNDGYSKHLDYRQMNYEVIGTELGRYIIKVTHPRVISTTYKNRVLDSALPFAEQENDEWAIVGKALTTLSFTLVVDLRGKLIEVRDTIGKQAQILAILKDRNTLDVKHHDLMVDRTNQPPYLNAAITVSMSAFKQVAATVANQGLEMPPLVDNITMKKDPISGLTVSATKDWTVKQAFADTNRYSTSSYHNMISLVNGDALPLYAEAVSKLDYADYYSPLNKAKRKIDDLLEYEQNEKGAQGVTEKMKRSLDSLDQYFKADDQAYLGAKMKIMASVDWDKYLELITKVPYEFLTDDNAVSSKLYSELEGGNIANLQKALHILFTKMLKGKKYPNNIESLSDMVHNRLTTQVFKADKPANIKAVLEAINRTEELRIPAVNEIFAGLKTYCLVKLTDDKAELAKLLAVSNNTLYDKAGRYRSLIYNALAEKHVPDSLLRVYNDRTIEMVKANIAAINSGRVPGVNNNLVRFMLAPRKAIYNKYLADAYYHKSLLQKDRGLAYLQMAMNYLPSQQDIIENKSRLENEYEYLPFKQYRELYLKAGENGSLGNDAMLKEYVNLVIIEPERYFELRERHLKAYPNGDFKKFFNDALKEKLPAVPFFALNDRLGKPVASGGQSKFIFVDFWGTWCGPCVDEIHLVEALYKNNPAPEKLSVTTIACHDKLKNVNDFMTAKKFTYPVLMSDDKVEKDFQVGVYPTKLLLLPNGTYLSIPSQEDYKPIVEKYLKWEL